MIIGKIVASTFAQVHFRDFTANEYLQRALLSQLENEGGIALSLPERTRVGSIGHGNSGVLRMKEGCIAAIRARWRSTDTPYVMLNVARTSASVRKSTESWRCFLSSMRECIAF